MKKGFTLIELIVVIAIIAILAAVTIPRISIWINGTKVRESAYKIVSDLQFAQTKAMEKGNSTVTFTSTSYQIEAPPGTVILTRTVPNGISISTTLPSNQVIFRRNKLPDRSGTVTVSGYGKTYTISISNISGRIKLE